MKGNVQLGSEVLKDAYQIAVTLAPGLRARIAVGLWLLKLGARALGTQTLEVRKSTPEPSATVLKEIATERLRQIQMEGWSTEHDDEHTDGSMAMAASCYCDHVYPTSPHAVVMRRTRTQDVDVSGGRGDSPMYQRQRVSYKVPMGWPQTWHPSWWKPKDRRSDLIRAGALIVAELERLDRAKAKEEKAVEAIVPNPEPVAVPPPYDPRDGELMK